MKIGNDPQKVDALKTPSDSVSQERIKEKVEFSTLPYTTIVSVLIQSDAVICETWFIISTPITRLGLLSLKEKTETETQNFEILSSRL